MKKDEVDNIAEEIADETFDFFKSKFKGVLDVAEKSSRLNQTVSSNMSNLDKRLNYMESRLENHIKNFNIVAVETDRLITEKTEDLARENDETIMKLVSDIQDLRDEVTRLKTDLRRKNQF